MLTFSTILLEKTFSIAKIVINRPEKRNAMNRALFADIREVFYQLQADTDIRVILVTGTNGTFSAGIDLQEIAQLGQEFSVSQLRHFAEELQASFNATEACEKPVVALIDGHCYGAGLELALACDFRIASETAKIGFLETQLGMIPDLGGTSRVVRALGVSRAKRIIMLAEVFGGFEAKEIGLVDWVVPSAQLEDKGIEIAEKLSKNAPLALGVAKKTIDRVYGMSIESALTVERLSQLELLRSEDIVEAITSKIEKRPPVFQGK